MTYRDMQGTSTRHGGRKMYCVIKFKDDAPRSYTKGLTFFSSEIVSRTVGEAREIVAKLGEGEIFSLKGKKIKA